MTSRKETTMGNKDSEICRTCKWWVTWSSVKGDCRKRAPIVVIGVQYQGQTVTKWPETGYSDSCGEYTRSANLPCQCQPSTKPQEALPSKSEYGKKEADHAKE